MEELDRDPDVKVAHLMARIRPHWDAVRTQNNLTAILERLGATPEQIDRERTRVRAELMRTG